VGVGLQSDTHTVSAVSTAFATASDLERELAAPFGIRVARLRT